MQGSGVKLVTKLILALPSFLCPCVVDTQNCRIYATRCWQRRKEIALSCQPLWGWPGLKRINPRQLAKLLHFPGPQFLSSFFHFTELIWKSHHRLTSIEKCCCLYGNKKTPANINLLPKWQALSSCEKYGYINLEDTSWSSTGLNTLGGYCVTQRRRRKEQEETDLLSSTFWCRVWGSHWTQCTNIVLNY